MDKYKLYNSFLEEWPVERVKNMSLQEYSNLNRSDSFCYWLESKTEKLGSIWGGSAYKFGIFEKADKTKTYTTSGVLESENYAWYSKYGSDQDEVYKKIHSGIIEIIEAAQNGDYEKIDQIDLGNAVKWKVAFLYSNLKIFNGFKKERLQEILNYLKIPYEKKDSFSVLQKKIMNAKPEEEDYFKFGQQVWQKSIKHKGKQYWIYAPGDNANMWEDFYEKGIMAIGWDKLGDLSEYKSKKEIQKILQELYGGVTSQKNNALCNYEFAHKIEVGDIIIVKKGRRQLLGYGEVTSEYYYDDEKASYYHRRKIDWAKKGSWDVNQDMTIKTLTNITKYDSDIHEGHKYYEYLIVIMNEEILQDTMEGNDSPIKLLKYKKQIILQGPPGTGKTREAKLIAKSVILTYGMIYEILSSTKTIDTIAGQASYEIVKLEKDAITLKKNSGKTDKTYFTDIKQSIIDKEWKKNRESNHTIPKVALAKYVYEHLENDYIKLIQFHPSYTYEDFVRGITARPSETGEGIVYEAENKTLAEFADRALENYRESKNSNENVVTRDKFKAFVNYVIEKIDKEEKFDISEKIYIFSVEENRFKYKGDNWTAHSNGLNMNFSQLKKVLELGLNSRQEINHCEELSSLARQHATYYQNVIQLYKGFISKFKPQKEKVELKNYVLIIDEINRANLSSVLGELIYALEYRGQPVESMYAVNESKELILPPNLYIIGTMNTADRSIVHIDYAIRRRFAFVEMLPKRLEDDDEIYFNINDFNQVARLFNENNVSPEFECKDVQIGHSYFILEKQDIKDGLNKQDLFDLKMKYEVLPILLEYVANGVLKGKIDEMEVKDYIEALV